MKKEQISFLSHSISPFFCLIWFLSSHLSFFSPFHLHSSVSPYCFFNILFYLSFLPLPRSLNRDPQPSIFYLFIFHVLSCTFLPSLPVFPLPYFCSSLLPPWFFSFHFFHFSILFFLSTPSSHFFTPCPTFIHPAFSPFFLHFSRGHDECRGYWTVEIMK